MRANARREGVGAAKAMQEICPGPAPQRKCRGSPCATCARVPDFTDVVLVKSITPAALGARGAALAAHLRKASRFETTARLISLTGEMIALLEILKRLKP